MEGGTMKKEVKGESRPLQDILNGQFSIDYYQRAYVWGEEQVEELITDISTEFLNNWKEGHKTEDTFHYDPYYLGEIILVDDNKTPSKKIIDGQQRITTLTLLFIYILRTYGEKHPELITELQSLIYKNNRGKSRFNLEIDGRMKCMDL